MKNLFLLFFLILSFGVQAQKEAPAQIAKKSKLSSKVIKTLNRLSVTTTAGTPSFGTKDMSQVNLKKLGNLSLGSLNVSYKMNPRLSFGVSTMGTLANPKSGYYNAKDEFFSYCDDDDIDDDLDDIDDLDDLDDDDEDCDDDEFGQNILGTVSWKLSNKIPFFIQGGAGYVFSSNAPTYTAMLGYNQKIFAGFGIMAGVRFSDVLYKKPSSAVSTISAASFKAEFGLSWNF